MTVPVVENHEAHFSTSCNHVFFLHRFHWFKQARAWRLQTLEVKVKSISLPHLSLSHWM